jgi:hypothetical protein
LGALPLHPAFSFPRETLLRGGNDVARGLFSDMLFRFHLLSAYSTEPRTAPLTPALPHYTMIPWNPLTRCFLRHPYMRKTPRMLSVTPFVSTRREAVVEIRRGGSQRQRRRRGNSRFAESVVGRRAGYARLCDDLVSNVKGQKRWGGFTFLRTT